ncbi:hydrolase [Marivirga tractuosa]|uniref:Alpha/beta hydrolase fold protein n=1 Tax=Marivirga tractuosa (strain ATCC 23168 / DSM 4126 / NBRC 15989 / NCIMB 1408 / VKM B-1430 / H-43) TaxID=643867 RepID=E4TPB6_MARTH|nr:alpha/beta hydrolase [Marivirga tractuosa]ADR20519.1 alpha/beta hydrolase fold protein [Marivirga tractuosa DSM 4126]BDD15033.1 hydrolase [Marivirga tractuosa]
MKKLFKILGIGILVLIGIVLIVLIGFYKADIPIQENHEKYFTDESKYLEIDSNRIHYRKVGQGPPLLLIHGSFSSLHTWEIWQDQLANHFTTISIDLPGHGLTGPNPQAQYDTDYYASVLWKMMDSLQYDSIAIAGNSMGGQVAYKMALQNPSRVQNLILLNSSGASLKKDTSKFRDQNKFSVFTLINHPIFSQLMTRITPKSLFEMSLEQVYYDKSKISEDKIQLYYDLMLQEGNREATLQRFKQRAPSEFDRLSEMEIPTLIVWGKYDNWIPVSHAYHFDSILPNSSLKIYDDGGHVPMEEIPVKTADDVLKFLKNHH